MATGRRVVRLICSLSRSSYLGYLFPDLSSPFVPAQEASAGDRWALLLLRPLWDWREKLTLPPQPFSLDVVLSFRLGFVAALIPQTDTCLVLQSISQ